MAASRHAVEEGRQPCVEQFEQRLVRQVGPAFVLGAQEGDALAPLREIVRPGQRAKAELADALDHRRLELVGIGLGQRFVLEQQRPQAPPAPCQHDAFAFAPLQRFLVDDPLGEQFFDLVEADGRCEEDARNPGPSRRGRRPPETPRWPSDRRPAAPPRGRPTGDTDWFPGAAGRCGRDRRAPAARRSSTRRAPRSPAPRGIRRRACSWIRRSAPSRLPLKAMSTRWRRSASRCPGGRRRKSRSLRIAASRAAILPCPSSRPFSTRCASRGCWPTAPSRGRAA